MTSKQGIDQVIERLRTIQEDIDITKKCKAKTQKVIAILQSGEELAVNKALLELEELNSLDLQSYHRTQLWDVISLLESVK